VYSISYRTELTSDADGGFTIHIAADQPADAPVSNWLPSTGPGEAWTLVLRLYLPRADVLNATWSPPAMTIQR
jgi:hypothetical protein